MKLPSSTSAQERILRYSVPEPNTGCWLWLGYTDKAGYGKITIRGQHKRVYGAHRISYEAFVGPIPAGLQLDHLCRVHSCVNPAHLEPVTCKTNVSRGINNNRRKTHCAQGHPFDEENTLRLSRGGRACRACGRRRQGGTGRVILQSGQGAEPARAGEVGEVLSCEEVAI